MKKTNAKDMNEATTKKTGTRRQSKKAIEGTLSLGDNISESIARNPETSGAKKTNASSGKPKGTVRKTAKPKNGTTKTTRKTSTRTKKTLISPKPQENLVLNEWNSVEMDDYVDEVFENSAEQFTSQEQKQKRNQVLDELIQEILPEENTANKNGKQSSSSLQEEDCKDERTGATMSGRSRPGLRWCKPTGFPLVGKTWMIKIMLALIILIVFLLFNYFVFTAKAPQRVLQYFSIATEEDRMLNHIGSPDMSETIAIDSVDLNSGTQTGMITEARASTIVNENPFQDSVEGKSDLEISRGELAFWENLAKTSFEEISEIRTNLARYKKLSSTEQDISKDISGITELDSVELELSQPEGVFQQEKAHLEMPLMKNEIAKTRGSVDEAGKNQSLDVRIGMEEDISLPSLWQFGESIGDVDTDRPMTENLSPGPEGGEIEARLQSIIVQIEALNTTTRDILSVLKEASPVSGTQDTNSEKDLSLRSLQPVPIPHVGINMADKFRIAGFPGERSTSKGDGTMILDSNRKDMVDNQDMNVSFMRNLRKGFDGKGSSKQNGMQTFPLLKFASNENLTIRSLSERDLGYEHMKGVTLGEEIPGFGLVLNIREDEKGRMIVMENGILYLN